MQSVSVNPLIATSQSSSAASLNFGLSQNDLLGNRLKRKKMSSANEDYLYNLICHPQLLERFLKSCLKGAEYIEASQRFQTVDDCRSSPQISHHSTPVQSESYL